MSALNTLENLIYRIIFDENYTEGQAIIDTNNLEIVLYQTLPNEDGSAGQEFATDVSAQGYAPVPIIENGNNKFASVSNSVITPFDGSAFTSWENVEKLNFGENTGNSDWPVVVGWGIKHSVNNTIYLADVFRDSSLQGISYTVVTGKEFLIPSGSFIFAID